MVFGLFCRRHWASILWFVCSRFEFLVIDRVLLLLTGLGCKRHWSLFHRLINETLSTNVSRAFAGFLKVLSLDLK